MSQPSALSAYLGTFAPSHSLDNDLQALITRHGKEAVRDAAKRLTKGAKGRKQEGDWSIIGPEISRKDAIDWIEGRDPLKLRTNYSIAQNYARRFPGQSIPSTHRRIMRKLQKQRVENYLYVAWQMSHYELSYQRQFDLYPRMPRNNEVLRKIFDRDHDLKMGLIIRYREQIGELDERLTYAQIQEALEATSLLAVAKEHANHSNILQKREGGLLVRYPAQPDDDKMASNSDMPK